MRWIARVVEYPRPTVRAELEEARRGERSGQGQTASVVASHGEDGEFGSNGRVGPPALPPKGYTRSDEVR